MSSPMYQAIADDLKSKIESGDLPAGKQIPTEDSLQKTYGASRNTIRDAIKQLISLAWSRPGLARAPSSYRRSTRSSPRSPRRQAAVSAAGRVPPSCPRSASSTGRHGPARQG